MADIPESAYHRAEVMLDEAKEYLPIGGALPEDEGGHPIPYAQVLATAGLGQAILALCDELRERHGT